MPDKNLVLAIGKEEGQGLEFKLNSKKNLKGGKKGKILTPFEPSEGRLYAIVPVKETESRPVPLRKKLSSEVVTSVVSAVEAHLENDPENQLVKDIANSSIGADITTTAGLAKYLRQFLYLFPTEGNEGLESVLNLSTEGKKKFNSALHIITVTGNSIEFGKPGVNLGGNKRTASISRNLSDSNNRQNIIKLKKHLEGMLSNADIKMLQTSDAEAVLRR